MLNKKENIYIKTFINSIIVNDLRSSKYNVINTRFPPEPNGYLHIGHAKSICLNFGLAYYYNGKCNLRFDDTNPEIENIKYVQQIKNDIQWLGFMWNGSVKYASDYFNIFYSCALTLIRKGLAYVDELSPEEVKKYRGLLNKPGKNSPYRDRSVQDNIILFNKMKNGYFKEGAACLRAKIDMSSSSIIMRDPILYRIKFTNHYQTKNKWCIYPTYDFAHCISDAIENITHSLCTLEFIDNRLLYNWILNNINIEEYTDIRPYQYEFSRLKINYTILSKRQLNILVKKNIVQGWDDPRMPTISGLRRRGYTPSSIREFCRRIGVTKQDNVIIEYSFLEHCIREELNKNARRAMAVVDPIKLIIVNLPEHYQETIKVSNHPSNQEMGYRYIKFTREIFIDRSDFIEQTSNTVYKKLTIGGTVKLRYTYFITAISVKKDNKGTPIIFCICHKNNKENFSVKNKAIIHWVSSQYGIPVEFRFYDKLFNEYNPSLSEHLSDDELNNKINPKSLIIYNGFVEPVVKDNIYLKKYRGPYQFERIGYFYEDINDSIISNLVFNRIVPLREIWKNKIK